MFSEGQTIVQRGLHHDGRVGAVESARVLRDGADALVTWIGPRSAVIRRATVSGEPIRYMQLADKLDIPTVPAVTEWTGPGVVVVTPPGAWHAIWWFFHETGEFRCWYINLQTPVRRWWGGFDMRDHALDVVVAADRSWRWKDEDEFADRTGHPLYWTADEAAEIRAEGERLIESAVAGRGLFDGRWCDFRPDPDWQPSQLPWWWDQLPAGESGPSEPGPRPGRLFQ
jgi:hypothetical protein